MAFSDNDAKALGEALNAAPFAADGWATVLALMAKAGGGWASQMIGVSEASGLVFSIEHALSASTMAEFERKAGYQASVNPRLGAFMRASLYAPVSEPDFVTPEEMSRSSFYNEVLKPNDCEYSLITQLNPIGDMRIGTCTMRSTAQGNYSAHERQTYEAIMPKIDAALRLQVAIETEAARFASHSFGCLEVPAFLFDLWGRVVFITEEGERLLSRQNFLRLAVGRLNATDARCDLLLQKAIARACASRCASHAGGSTIMLRDDNGVRRAEVAALPQRDLGLRMGAVAVLVLTREKHAENAMELLQEAFALTRTEAAIAIAVADGQDLPAISQQRGASVATIRTQLKAVFAKTGARSQSHLVSIIFPLVRS